MITDQFKIRKIGNVTHKTKLKWKFKMIKNIRIIKKLDPVGSTVRYEMMKLCAGSV